MNTNRNTIYEFDLGKEKTETIRIYPTHYDRYPFLTYQGGELLLEGMFDLIPNLILIDPSIETYDFNIRLTNRENTGPGKMPESTILTDKIKKKYKLVRHNIQVDYTDSYSTEIAELGKKGFTNLAIIPYYELEINFPKGKSTLSFDYSYYTQRNTSEYSDSYYLYHR